MDRQLSRINLDSTRGQRRVHRALGARDDLALDPDHRLRLQMRGLLADRRICLRVKHHLRDAFAVAQIDKENPAVVADGIHPT